MIEAFYTIGVWKIIAQGLAKRNTTMALPEFAMTSDVCELFGSLLLHIVHFTSESNFDYLVDKESNTNLDTSYNGSKFMMFARQFVLCYT